MVDQHGSWSIPARHFSFWYCHALVSRSYRRAVAGLSLLFAGNGSDMSVIHSILLHTPENTDKVQLFPSSRFRKNISTT